MSFVLKDDAKLRRFLAHSNFFRSFLPKYRRQKHRFATNGRRRLIICRESVFFLKKGVRQSDCCSILRAASTISFNWGVGSYGADRPRNRTHWRIPWRELPTGLHRWHRHLHRPVFLFFTGIRTTLRGLWLGALLQLDFSVALIKCILLGGLSVCEDREAIFKRLQIHDLKSIYEHKARHRTKIAVSGFFFPFVGCSRRWSQPRGTSLPQSLAPLQGISDGRSTRGCIIYPFI